MIKSFLIGFPQQPEKLEFAGVTERKTFPPGGKVLK